MAYSSNVIFSHPQSHRRLTANTRQEYCWSLSGFYLIQNQDKFFVRQFPAGSYLWCLKLFAYLLKRRQGHTALCCVCTILFWKFCWSHIIILTFSLQQTLCQSLWDLPQNSNTVFHGRQHHISYIGLLLPKSDQYAYPH